MPMDQGQPEIPTTLAGIAFAVFSAIGGFFTGRRAARKNGNGYVSDDHIERTVLRVLEEQKEKERYLKEAISAALDQRLKALEHPTGPQD